MVMTLEKMEKEIVCSEKSPTPCTVCNCHALREACRQIQLLTAKVSFLKSANELWAKRFDRKSK